MLNHGTAAASCCLRSRQAAVSFATAARASASPASRTTDATRASVLGEQVVEVDQQSGTASGVPDQWASRPRLVFARFTLRQVSRTITAACGPTSHSWPVASSDLTQRRPLAGLELACGPAPGLGSASLRRCTPAASRGQAARWLLSAIHARLEPRKRQEIVRPHPVGIRPNIRRRCFHYTNLHVVPAAIAHSRVTAFLFYPVDHRGPR